LNKTFLPNSNNNKTICNEKYEDNVNDSDTIDSDLTDSINSYDSDDDSVNDNDYFNEDTKNESILTFIQNEYYCKNKLEIEKEYIDHSYNLSKLLYNKNLEKAKTCVFTNMKSKNKKNIEYDAFYDETTENQFLESRLFSTFNQFKEKSNKEKDNENKMNTNTKNKNNETARNELNLNHANNNTNSFYESLMENNTTSETYNIEYNDNAKKENKFNNNVNDQNNNICEKIEKELREIELKYQHLIFILMKSFDLKIIVSLMRSKTFILDIYEYLTQIASIKDKEEFLLNNYEENNDNNEENNSIFFTIDTSIMELFSKLLAILFYNDHYTICSLIIKIINSKNFTSCMNGWTLPLMMKKIRDLNLNTYHIHNPKTITIPNFNFDQENELKHQNNDHKNECVNNVKDQEENDDDDVNFVLTKSNQKYKNYLKLNKNNTNEQNLNFHSQNEKEFRKIRRNAFLTNCIKKDVKILMRKQSKILQEKLNLITISKKYEQFEICVSKCLTFEKNLKNIEKYDTNVDYHPRDNQYLEYNSNGNKLSEDEKFINKLRKFKFYGKLASHRLSKSFFWSSVCSFDVIPHPKISFYCKNDNIKDGKNNATSFHNNKNILENCEIYKNFDSFKKEMNIEYISNRISPNHLDSKIKKLCNDMDKEQIDTLEKLNLKKIIQLREYLFDMNKHQPILSSTLSIAMRKFN
jgi:hypothetical protein